MKIRLFKNTGTVGLPILLILFLTNSFVFKNESGTLGYLGGWSLLFDKNPTWIDIPRGSMPVILTHVLLIILLSGLIISLRKGKNHHFYLFLVSVCGLLSLFWIQEQLAVINSPEAKITLSHTINFYAMVFLFILIGATEYLKSLRSVSHLTENQPSRPNQHHFTDGEGKG